ncbi:unnamed protein product [Ambrosiozyma monospora]|uniref:Unnamed protein product n=1 Tax=Ambrosiozyma monospora TaxID=43982 RepID=A0ACB5T4R8_AMBMO|nr:unnamed protein product [Ambrosiozyma monospora]
MVQRVVIWELHFLFLNLSYKYKQTPFSSAEVPITNNLTTSTSTTLVIFIMPTQEELMQMYSQVTILQKIVTLQHIHSLYLAAQQSQPPHRDISFNILQLQKMINNNPLINPDFDLLDINGSLNALNLKRQNGGAIKNILNAIQIVQVITETLSIEGPNGVHETPIQQVPKTTVFKLSNLINANLVKDRLIKILNKYKNTTLEEITALETNYKAKKNEIELVENGKVEDKVLYQEFVDKLNKEQRIKQLRQKQLQQQLQKRAQAQQQAATQNQMRASSTASKQQMPVKVASRFPTTALRSNTNTSNRSTSPAATTSNNSKPKPKPTPIPIPTTNPKLAPADEANPK